MLVNSAVSAFFAIAAILLSGSIIAAQRLILVGIVLIALYYASLGAFGFFVK